MDLHIPVVNDFGGAPFAEHNVVCPVCQKSHSVLILNTGIFTPCWDCQKDGWITKQFPKWVIRVMKIFEKKIDVMEKK